MTIDALYRSIRSDARKLARRDSLEVIWAYSQFLQVNDFEIPRDIQVSQRFLDAHPKQGILAEWSLEHLAREIIRCGDEVARDGKTLKTWDTLADIANALRDLELEIYKQLVGAKYIQHEMMRIMHRQFVWQQQRFHWRWVIRYYKLFNTEALSAHAVEATGLTVDQIFLIGMCYLGHFGDQPRWLRRVPVDIPGLTAEHVELFLAFTSQKRSALAEKLRGEHVLDEDFPYRYSSFRAYPIVEYSNLGVDEIACPIPTLLFWRFTTGLYYSLRDQAGFPTPFGKSYERYVGEVLATRVTNPDMSVLPEAKYYVGRNRKDSVDWIVQEGAAAAIFIECKTMRLTWASKSGMANLDNLAQDIRKLAGAVVQAYKAIRDYRNGHYPHLAFDAARQIYPIVLTLEDWYCHGMYLPALLDEAVRTTMRSVGLDLDWLTTMPYAVVSIDEFETAIGVTSAAGIVRFWSGKLDDADRRRWPYRSYCGDDFPAETAALPRLFHDEFEAMFANMGA